MKIKMTIVLFLAVQSLYAPWTFPWGREQKEKQYDGFGREIRFKHGQNEVLIDGLWVPDYHDLVIYDLVLKHLNKKKAATVALQAGEEKER